MYWYTALSTVFIVLCQRYQVGRSIRVKGSRMGTCFPTLPYLYSKHVYHSSESVCNMLALIPPSLAHPLVSAACSDPSLPDLPILGECCSLAPIPSLPDLPILWCVPLLTPFPSLPDLTVHLHFPVGECCFLTPISSLPDLPIHRFPPSLTCSSIGECSCLLHFPPVLTACLSALSSWSVPSLALIPSLFYLPIHW